MRLGHAVSVSAFQAHQEGLYAPCAHVEAQFVPFGNSGPDDGLVAVELGGFEYAGREADTCALHVVAVNFIEAYHIRVAVLGFLESTQLQALALHACEAEGPAETAGMADGGEGLNGLV